MIISQYTNIESCCTPEIKCYMSITPQLKKKIEFSTEGRHWMCKCQVSCVFSKNIQDVMEQILRELTLPGASADIPRSGQRTINYESTHMILVKTCSCQAGPGFFHPQSLLILFLSWLRMIGDFVVVVPSLLPT